LNGEECACEAFDVSPAPPEREQFQLKVGAGYDQSASSGPSASASVR